MQEFTGKEYIFIDIANHFGLDKETFETRLAWVQDNLAELETKMYEADEPALYTSAVMALRDAQKGVPSGHLVGFDATASGIQLMACLSGCEVTALSTGLVDPDNRADIYTDTTIVMNRLLEEKGREVTVPRKDIKQASMTHFYGSRNEPKLLFGVDTPELAAFYDAQHTVAPGACAVMEEMLDAWDRSALEHSWTMPDGFHAHVKVMQQTSIKVEVDELDHATFTHLVYENRSTHDQELLTGEFVPNGLSLAANITHSIDGMVVREINRRCNYDVETLTKALHKLNTHLADKTVTTSDKFISLGYVEAIDTAIATLTDNELADLSNLINRVLFDGYKPFPIVCIHDDFKCHANNMNRLRYWYKEILAEIAEIDLLGDILSQLKGKPITFNLCNNNLPDMIRNSNYALS